MPALAHRPGSRAALRGWPGTLAAALLLTLPRPHDTCGDPPKFKTMKLLGDSKPHYYPGEKIFYKCLAGHDQKLNHPLMMHCQRNNSWHHIDEACVRKSCPIPKLKNGEVYAPNQTLWFDNEAHFICNEGYDLYGPNVIICLLDGNTVHWSDIYPRCQKTYCPPPAQIKYGTYSNSQKKLFEYNEFVTYSCDRSPGPYEYSLVGESLLFCSEYGMWSSNPPQCKVVKCEHPVIENGKPASKIEERFYYQAVVMFQCNEGFSLNGSRLVFCGADNNWEPEVPTCVPGSKSNPSDKSPVPYKGHPGRHGYVIAEVIEELDAGLVAVIILIILIGVTLVGTCIYKCIQKRKKR